MSQDYGDYGDGLFSWHHYPLSSLWEIRMMPKQDAFVCAVGRNDGHDSPIPVRHATGTARPRVLKDG